MRQHLGSLVGLVVVGFCLGITPPTIAQEIKPNPLLLAELEESLPQGWKLSYDQAKKLITIESNLITVTGTPPSGNPSEQEGSYTLELIVGERLKIIEHSKRQQGYETIVKTIKSKRELSKLYGLPWRPDFFDDEVSYEVLHPFRAPVNVADRKLVASIYQIVRKHCAVYPTSPHADPEYYPELLRPFGSEK